MIMRWSGEEIGHKDVYFHSSRDPLPYESQYFTPPSKYKIFKMKPIPSIIISEYKEEVMSFLP